MARVFVAMSGGVDSSVAAALCLEQGHEVTGVTMQLWPSGDESSGGCCSVSAVRDARRVCDLLGIPHYTLNFRDSFERFVVTPFADEYAAGRTPNPCIDCNDVVKFGDLLARVTSQGAEFLATGHYARILADETSERWLARGLDQAKDQSYFLYRMTPAQLAHVLFPVGEMHKSDVRAIAQRLGLAVADKRDSQELCFAPDDDYASAVGERRPDALRPGRIVDAQGVTLGTHDGIARYTVGQRHGLGIAVGEPRYVTDVRPETNEVVVGALEEVMVTRVTAERIVWRGEPAEPLEVCLRYRMKPRRAHAHVEGDELVVELEEPVMRPAPGQAVVCYRGDIVIGGGVACRP